MATESSTCARTRFQTGGGRSAVMGTVKYKDPKPALCPWRLSPDLGRHRERPWLLMHAARCK